MEVIDAQEGTSISGRYQHSGSSKRSNGSLSPFDGGLASRSPPSLTGTDCSDAPSSSLAPSRTSSSHHDGSSRTSSYHTAREEITRSSSPSGTSFARDDASFSTTDRKWLESYINEEDDLDCSALRSADLAFSSSVTDIILETSASDLQGLEIVSASSSAALSDNNDHLRDYEYRMHQVIENAKSYPPPPPPPSARTSSSSRAAPPRRSTSSVSSSRNLRRQMEAARQAQLRLQNEVNGGGGSSGSGSPNGPVRTVSPEPHSPKRSSLVDTNIALGDSSSSEDELRVQLQLQHKNRDGEYPHRANEHHTASSPSSVATPTNVTYYGMDEEPINSFLRRNNTLSSSVSEGSVSSYYVSDTDDERSNAHAASYDAYYGGGARSSSAQHREAAELLRLSQQLRSQYDQSRTHIRRTKSNTTATTSSSAYLEPPRTTNTIRIHVYDLLSSDAYVELFSWGCNIPVGRCFHAVNDGLHAVGSGAYHVGVEVNGIEFAFGANDIPGLSGVFTCNPRHSPGYQYRTTLDFGDRATTRNAYNDDPRRYGNQQVSREEGVQNFINGHLIMQSMAYEYLGCDYDLLRHNCCTFARDACLRLGVAEDEIPSWFHNLASTGADAHDAVANVEATVERGVAPLKKMLSGGVEAEPELHQEENGLRQQRQRRANADANVNNNKPVSAIDSIVDVIGRGLCFGPRVLSNTTTACS
mmetsp:Transcript_13051/g.28286  ORF Transcript_13051/g.28286 Transcript_13051/m.28286 type:complete len:700 (-) Transcript_13051:61-2160(-)